jgi:hypothetical protein
LAVFCVTAFIFGVFCYESQFWGGNRRIFAPCAA